MKNTLALLFLCVLWPDIYAQTISAKNYVSQPALGISFSLYDYLTPQRIRATSLSSVLREGMFAQIRETSPGIGLTYFRGLSNHVDFAGTLNGAFVNVPLNNTNINADNNFLLESQAAVNLKMLTNKYWVDPYLIAGIGASVYKGYYGAYIPLGAGIKINFFDEAALFIVTQYVVPVTTETNTYHFVHSIGISGILGQSKQKQD